MQRKRKAESLPTVNQHRKGGKVKFNYPKTGKIHFEDFCKERGSKGPWVHINGTAGLSIKDFIKHHEFRRPQKRLKVAKRATNNRSDEIALRLETIRAMVVAGGVQHIHSAIDGLTDCIAQLRAMR